MAATDADSRSWAPRTGATYAADWPCSPDWCEATDHQALPADQATLLKFLADCPAAAATRRRRVIAIDHHHTAAGYPSPGADPGQGPARPAAHRTAADRTGCSVAG